jgi:hypothetical protein
VLESNPFFVAKRNVMSLGILRSLNFLVEGDGVGNVLTIDLRQLREYVEITEPNAGSPIAVDKISIAAAGGGIPPAPAISFTTMANFILTITFAAALPSGPGIGYQVNLSLLCPGAV